MIYAIHAEGTEFVKIGIANGVSGRLSTLQTGCPFKLVLLGHADWPDSHETRIHRFLGQYHERGEWFRWCDPIAYLVHDMRKGTDWRMRGSLSVKPKRLQKILELTTIVQSANGPQIHVSPEVSLQAIDSAENGLKNHYVKPLYVPRLGEVDTSEP